VGIFFKKGPSKSVKVLFLKKKGELWRAAENVPMISPRATMAIIAITILPLVVLQNERRTGPLAARGSPYISMSESRKSERDSGLRRLSCECERVPASSGMLVLVGSESKSASYPSYW